MKKYIHQQWLFRLAIVTILIQSCGIPNTARKTIESPVPESFSSTQIDTNTIAKVSWKDFFADPYLTTLVDSAIVNNYEINMLLQRISRTQNEIQTRGGEYLPFVSIGTEAGVDKVGEFTRNGAVEENLEIEEGRAFPEPLGNFRLGLFASWELDIWKKLRNGQKIAVMEYLASVEGKNLLITNLIAEIAESYYELRALDSKLNIVQQNLTLQRNALDIVKTLQQAGRANSLAIKRFEAELKKNESEVFALQQEITLAENRINFLLGRPPQSIDRPTDNFIDFQPRLVNTGIPAQLLANRPDIRQAELELQAANLNIEVARANFYPSVTLHAGIGTEAFNPKFLFKTPASMLFSLAGDAIAPLVNKKAIQANYKNATALQIEKVYEYEQTILQAYIEVANQLSNLSNLEESWDLKNMEVEALNESIEVVNQLFQSARVEYLEVLLTQRDALEARLDLVETRQRQMEAVVLTYKALGGGWQ